MPDKITVANQPELSSADQVAAVPLAISAGTASAPAKDRSLAHAIGKNTIFGVVARVAQAGTRLITVPIVIAHLGLGGYGIWAIIMTAAAYMRFGSIGIKSAFQSMSQRRQGMAITNKPTGY